MSGTEPYDVTGYCDQHQKITYLSRAAARRRSKMMTGVRPYRCEFNDQFWHIGHLPTLIRQGRVSRDNYRFRRPDEQVS